MAINYAKQFDTRTPGRSNKTSVYTKAEPTQTPNSCGALVWEVNDWDRLNRFLVLGAEGGTYYIGQQDLLKANHDVVLRLLAHDGPKVVATAVSISQAGQAYKNDPAVFVLALAAAHGDAATKQAARAAVPQICRISTHLFHWMQYVMALRGTGRFVKTAVGGWYAAQDAAKLAYQAIKYQQRDGWSHRDMLRLAHPLATSPEQDAVFRWMVAGKKGLECLKYRQVKKRPAGKEAVERSYPDLTECLPAIIAAFEEAKTADTKRLINLITEHNLPREAIPTEKLNSVEVWEALLQKMPLNAMIRNLSKMTSIGLLKPLSVAAKLVAERLRDEVYLKKSRVHPMQVLLAAKTYAQGRGIKGSLTWTPVTALLSALDDGFYRTFANVKPIGKPVLMALDVSGSMTSPIMGSPISACEATTALALVHINVEPDGVHAFGFNLGMQELPIRKGMSLGDAMRYTENINGGGTNVSLAYEYALKHRLKVGGFVVMTDSETNGGAHPFQRLREYRDKFVADARSVVLATTSTSFTVNDPSDRYGLDVAGFDASVPAFIADFIREDLGAAAP
jgi:60 kDa SS-A/Ro ribonucleoprotein